MEHQRPKSLADTGDRFESEGEIQTETLLVACDLSRRTRGRNLSASHSTSSPRSDSNCSIRRAIPQ